MQHEQVATPTSHRSVKSSMSHYSNRSSGTRSACSHTSSRSSVSTLSRVSKQETKMQSIFERLEEQLLLQKQLREKRKRELEKRDEETQDIFNPKFQMKEMESFKTSWTKKRGGRSLKEQTHRSHLNVYKL